MRGKRSDISAEGGEWRNIFRPNFFRIHNAHEREAGHVVTLSEVARAVGVHQTLLSLYRGGKAAPDVPGLLRLARYYGVDPAEFFGTAEQRRELIAMERAAAAVASASAAGPSGRKRRG